MNVEGETRRDRVTWHQQKRRIRVPSKWNFKQYSLFTEQSVYVFCDIKCLLVFLVLNLNVNIDLNSIQNKTLKLW